MRFSVWVLAVVSVWSYPAHANDDQIKRGPPPIWAVQSEPMPVPADAKGMLFVRRNDTQIHLAKHGYDQYFGYRIKVLHPNALDLGNLSLNWNPVSGNPTIHVIKIYRDGATIDVLANSSFQILRREDQMEVARLDGMLTAILTIPDLRVGDELDVGMTIPLSDPTMGINEAGLLMLGSDPAPGRFRLGLSWEEGRKPNIKISPDIEPATEKGEHDLVVRFDNPPMLIPPKDAPARYQWQRILEYSHFADWPTVSRHFAPLYAKAAKLAKDSPLKREAAEIAAASSDPLARANAALKLVQQDVRYIYVGLDNGNLTPASADETWQRRYGDCKGKTAMLLALLTELGIEAEPVLVNGSGTDDGFDQRLPNPGLFNHVLVRARIAGENYWLDGTLPAVFPPKAEPLIAYRWVLPLSAKGGSLEQLSWQPPTRPDEISLYEIDARTGFDQPVPVISTNISRGLKAAQEQMQLSALTHDQLLNAFRQQLVGDEWESIDDVVWEFDQKAEASILKITGSRLIDWEDDGSGARSIALPGGGFNPPEKRVRPKGQDQNLPYFSKPEYNCYVTTVRLPSATKEANWYTKDSFDTHIFGRNYYRIFEIRDGSVRMVRGSRVNQPEIDAESARMDNSLIPSFDNSMGYIFYDPNDPGFTVKYPTQVPTTDEIDWTGEGVPCLSAEALRP